MKPKPLPLLIALAILFPAAAGAVPIKYIATLDGASESPPVVSTGSGKAVLVLDTMAHTLGLDVEFADLIGTTSAAHIHAPTAAPGVGNTGVATQVPTFAGFPLGVSAGVYSMTFDLTQDTSFNPSYLTGNGGTAATAEAALAAALADGKAYLNIHTTSFPAGEIRGFFQTVPEGGSGLGLLVLAVSGLAGARWRVRHAIAT